MATCDKYREAVELYSSTSLSITEISRQCSVSRAAFASYLRRRHRDLMFRRRGFGISMEEADAMKLHERRGQRPCTRQRYGKAIEACASLDFISCNVSDIARRFGLDPSCLIKQLQRHFPDLINWRREERVKRGCSNNVARGVRSGTLGQYAGAIAHLDDNYVTLSHAADMFGVSYAGLREHILTYHRRLSEKREETRTAAMERSGISRMKGELTGNGTCHLPAPEQQSRYEEAVKLYRATEMTQLEISRQLSVPLPGLRNHIRVWHREAIIERRGADPESQPVHTLEGIKPYNRAAALKYADAIARLKEGGRTVAAVAREYGFNPDVFRQYLHEHEPELASALGMKMTGKGRLTACRSAERYAEAIRLYATTDEPLKSIAERLGLQYKSLWGYMRRHHSDISRRHDAEPRAVVDAENAENAEDERQN